MMAMVGDALNIDVDMNFVSVRKTGHGFYSRQFPFSYKRILFNASKYVTNRSKCHYSSTLLRSVYFDNFFGSAFSLSYM